MKNNKMLVTAYSLLPITIGLSATNVALAEENLETITVSTELDNSKSKSFRKENRCGDSTRAYSK